MSPVRVLIADDHPLFRDGMHGLLDSVEETEVVGEAANGEEAVALARELRPDVILMDLNTPGMNGIVATREVLEENPNAGVLILSRCSSTTTRSSPRCAPALRVTCSKGPTRTKSCAP